MEHLTYNQKIENNGIEIIRRGKNVFLKFGDNTIRRPNNPEDCRDACLNAFNIDIDKQ